MNKYTRAKLKAEDPERYRALKRGERQRHRARHPEAAAKYMKRYLDKLRAKAKWADENGYPGE